MGGGLMQLVAYGAQDVYLTGNPQITFFKVVYRRHTNFSMECIEQTFNGTTDFSRKASCTISRNGDLVHSMHLQCTLPAVNASEGWCEDVGFFLIKNSDIEIGGQRIDRHYGEWMHIWKELTITESKLDSLKNMIGTTSAMQGTGASATTIYVPFYFWFCRNPGLALPLIALQYHEVKLNIEFNSLSGDGGLIRSTTASPATSGSLTNVSLWVDYIYLDTDERRRFAQVSHEYLIEQLQFSGNETVTSSTQRLKLNFNHPVKELVWVTQLNTSVAHDNDATYNTTEKNNDLKAFTSSSANITSAAKLQLNGHDRFAERKGAYFNFVQPYNHHTASPANGINSYSFALKPEEHQPSGTCNFSRIDTAILQLTLIVSSSAKTRVYATNYNVLRVMSGMGGLAYSN